jgi:hypothetical protein
MGYFTINHVQFVLQEHSYKLGINALSSMSYRVFGREEVSK